jgi:glycosyltransferase involved in cell wall biosynthesis
MSEKKIIPSVEISIVIPVYGADYVLEELYFRLVSVLERITDRFEIIFVNDASPDDSQSIIERLALSDCRVRGIKFSRNFGQHRAIAAGLDYCRGRWVVVMDCDLQDAPEEITRLYQEAQKGFDVVIGYRRQRRDHILKVAMSRAFHHIFRYLADSKTYNQIGNFGIYSRTVIESINSLREQNRSFGLFAIWVGFKRTEIDVEHAKRKFGESSYSWRKSVALATDSIIAHSNKLLTIAVQIGFLMSFLSFGIAFWYLIGYFFFTRPLEGWTSLLVSIYFVAGLIISAVGVVGLYVGKIFDEVKARPLYIIESTTF